MRRCRSCSWWQPPRGYQEGNGGHGLCTDPDCPRILTAADAGCDRRPVR